MLRTLTALIFSAGAATLALPASAAHAETQTAIFAGGCFWCVEKDFDHVPGVTSTTSGYIGGTNDNPTYEDHTAGQHREAVKVEYDASKVSYDALLAAYWHSVDPTDDGGQFCDRGHSYTTAIYAVGKDQLAEAEKSKLAIAAELKKPIATEIIAAPTFWPAEEYHQNYYEKNPVRYKYYRYNCGRDQRVDEVWGKSAHQGIEGY